MSPELLRWSHSGCAKGNNCHLSNRKKPTIPISLWWIKHQCEEKPLLGWCNSLKLYSTKYHMTACFLNIPQHFSALLQQQSSENVNHVKQSENSSFICLIETINVHQCATTHTRGTPQICIHTHENVDDPASVSRWQEEPPYTKVAFCPKAPGTFSSYYFQECKGSCCFSYNKHKMTEDSIKSDRPTSLIMQHCSCAATMEETEVSVHGVLDF